MAPIHEHRRKGLPSHETGATGLPALRLRSTAYLGGDRRAAHRATGLPGPAWVLRKGGICQNAQGEPQASRLALFS